MDELKKLLAEAQTDEPWSGYLDQARTALKETGQ